MIRGVGKLIYSAITSLDGYIEDADGHFEWSAPDEEVFSFVNQLERPIGVYLYGRRMYEAMAVWEIGGDDAAVEREFGEIWRAAEKVVFSRTLQAPSSARTRIEREFDSAEVRRMKESSASDLTIAGAELGGQAIAAGLVDEIQLFLTPIVVGGGKRALPDGVRLALELVEERRFRGGVVFLRYQNKGVLK